MSDIQAVMRRIYGEVFTEGNIELIDEVMHKDFVEHEELPPGIPPGREAPKAMIAMMHSAFPDFRADVEEILQDGNKVIARARFSGTHQGDFMGMPATGNRFDISVIDIIEFDGDKAIGHWGLMDTAAMMQQLGVGGPPA